MTVLAKVAWEAAVLLELDNDVLLLRNMLEWLYTFIHDAASATMSSWTSGCASPTMSTSRPMTRPTD
jgi:hypothetical protein